MNFNYSRLFSRTASVLTAAVALTALCTQAAAEVYDFTYVLSGTTGPAGACPWVEATVADLPSGGVRLTVNNLGLTGSENQDLLFFNLNPSLDPTSLSFSFVSQSGSFVLPDILKGVNAYKADGDGYYDVQFAFSTGNQADRFRAGQSVVYDISGIPGLSAADFDYPSYDGGGRGQFYMAAHIQQIAVPGQTSAWVGVYLAPEPSVLALLGWGAAALLMQRRRN